jgi:hypothetical protein
MTTTGIMRAAWLAGLVDGEGTVLITLASRTGTYSPCIAIQMTCMATIERSRDIMEDLGVSGVRVTRITRKNAAHSIVWQVRVRRLKSVLILARELQKFCLTKRAQLALVEKFCLYRLAGAKDVAGGRVVSTGNRWGKRHFNGQEKDIYLELRGLNKKGRNDTPV